MKSILVLALALTSTFAMANSKCDFEGYLSDDEAVKELSVIQIENNTKLSPAQAKEIVFTAADVEGAKKNMTPAKAVKLLKENSEGGDLYYYTIKKNKVVYTVVKYWPGGNAVGFIFKKGVAIGSLSDDDVTCL